MDGMRRRRVGAAGVEGTTDSLFQYEDEPEGGAGARRRTTAPVLDAPGLPMPANQPGQLCPRQPRHLRQGAPGQPLVQLAEPPVVQPHQRPAHELVDGLPVGSREVHRLAAPDEGTHLVQSLPPRKRGGRTRSVCSVTIILR